jgi:hypothetical protein
MVHDYNTLYPVVFQSIEKVPGLDGGSDEEEIREIRICEKGASNEVPFF